MIKQQDQQIRKESNLFSDAQMHQIMKLIQEVKGDVSHKVNNLVTDSVTSRQDITYLNK